MRRSQKWASFYRVHPDRRLAVRKACKAIVAASSIALTYGCASHQPSPAPKGLSLANATIVPEPAAPTLIVSALPGGKAGGAGVGAGKGLGFGAFPPRLRSVQWPAGSRAGSPPKPPKRLRSRRPS
jgi:hypothetical protein